MPRRTVAALLVLIALAPWAANAQRQISAPDPIAAAALARAVDRLLADRWYPGIPRAKGDPPAAEDEALLVNFLSSSNIEVRRLALRSVGRFLNPLDAPMFESVVVNPRQPVALREEALFWLIRVLGVTQDAAKRIDAHDRLLDLVRDANGKVILDPDTPVDDDALFDSIARLGGLNEATIVDLEQQWVEAIDRRWPYNRTDPLLALATTALRYLERMLAMVPNRSLQPRTRSVLGRVALYGLVNESTGPSLPALEALTHAGVKNRLLATSLLPYSCTGQAATPTCGWEYRRQAVLLIDVKDPEVGPAIDDGLRDPSTLVRLELYRRLAGTVDERKTCAPFMNAFQDQSPVIRLEALDWLSPVCKERDAIVLRLKAQAINLGDEPEFANAPFAARALLALARFSPPDVRAITEKMTASANGWNGVWVYRAAAARAAGIMRDEAFALRFVDDPHPNVKIEALNALLSMNSESRWPHALAALGSDDDRVVYLAAVLLRGFSDREAMMHPLVAALDRITSRNRDNSRPARLEILARLKEIAPPDRQGIVVLNFYIARLEPYLKDVDPSVATAVADVIGLMYGTRPKPSPTRRRFDQPTPVTEPASVSVSLSNGDSFSIELNVDEAPLAVGRFLELVKSRHYDGQSFYRLLPMNLIQAGNPEGSGRFSRDELGRERQRHGVVSWVSQGPDTGDAEFFVNLLDVRARDYRHTVLGYVSTGLKQGISVPGMDIVVDLIEGARIRTIAGVGRK